VSHHFDTPTAQRDPRINVCDFYLFQGAPGTTVMAMTVNPDAGLSAPDTFHEEGLYAFRFDLNGDAREELAFKIVFDEPAHGGAEGLTHVQNFEIRRAVGPAAKHGSSGDPIIAGRTGTISASTPGVMAFAGLAPDLFAGDAVALGVFRNAFFREGRFEPSAFRNRKNFFETRNVTAIVLQVPSTLIGSALVHGWATASLYGHAPELQVSRWGLPLITNIFMPNLDRREAFNRADPDGDESGFAAEIEDVIARLTKLSGSTTDPSGYAKRLVGRLCPATLPYVLGSVATFNQSEFNGRNLTDDVMDVMLSLATNTALGDGVAPDSRRLRDEFPFFGAPYSTIEQANLAPAHPRPAK
jgi:Domain of unknown function (DUF4331)